jgi:hypothetical protein
MNFGMNIVLLEATSTIITCKCYKGKGKFRPRRGHEGPGVEERYRSTFSLTSAGERGGWSTPRRFTPGNDSVTII